MAYASNSASHPRGPVAAPSAKIRCIDEWFRSNSCAMSLAFGVTLVIGYHAIQGKSPDDGGMHEQMAADLGDCEAAGSICGMPDRCCSGFQLHAGKPRCSADAPFEHFGGWTDLWLRHLWNPFTD